MGNFPCMADGMSEWLNQMTFKLVTHTIVNFQAVETLTTIKFSGVLYPSTPETIMEKPEGQRSWKWWTLLTSYRLNTDDVIIDKDGVQFRVSSKKNYSSAGFYEYDIQQDWTAS